MKAFGLIGAGIAGFDKIDEFERKGERPLLFAEDDFVLRVFGVNFNGFGHVFKGDVGAVLICIIRTGDGEGETGEVFFWLLFLWLFMERHVCGHGFIGACAVSFFDVAIGASVLNIDCETVFYGVGAFEGTKGKGVQECVVFENEKVAFVVTVDIGALPIFRQDHKAFMCCEGCDEAADEEGERAEMREDDACFWPAPFAVEEEFERE